ncbi:MAG: beta-ketoacyl synthase N-terminal-like domain-containing protein [Planctomycetota bacterium]
MPRTEPSQPNPLAIAITGVGIAFPGARTLVEFWRLIAAGRTALARVPDGRWTMPADVAWSQDGPAPDRVVATNGGLLETSAVDLSGLRITADELRALDPQVSVLLQAARAAVTDAHELAALDRQRVAVVLGNIVLPTEKASALSREYLRAIFAEQLGLAATAPHPPTDARNRYAAGLPAGLLATAFGFGGGAFTIDAACASSLYALKLAATELTAGRVDAVLAGGLSRPDALYTQMGFSQLRALSPSGECRPFDARANGLVVGEGAGVFVLRRLADAVADGHRIYAVIRGIGVSNDVGGSLLAPESEGQLRALRAAYRQAGWSPQDIDLIECHATGTLVGDAIEARSLRALWREGASSDDDVGRCVLGSVKSNVGHLLTAAGAAGLAKVLLAFEHDALPPTAGFATPNAALELAASPFRVLRSSEPWRARTPGVPRRAAINAFGFGGINAHVLLEEWLPAATAIPKPVAPVTPTPTPNDSAIAIVGIGLRLPGCADAQDAVRRVTSLSAGSLAPVRDLGASFGLSDVRGHIFGAHSAPAIPAGRYRIPPRELDECLPQQLLLLEAARDALVDANWQESASLRTGVLIGIGLDANTTDFSCRWSLPSDARNWARASGRPENGPAFDAWLAELLGAAGPALNANRTMGALGGIVASRVAREFRIGGPSFTVSSEDTSSQHAIELGVRLLQDGELDAVVVGGVDLAGDARAVLGTLAASGRTAQASEFLCGEGAGAVVLKRLADAERDGDRIYALVRGAARGASDAAGVARAFDAATREADAAGVATIARLELCGIAGDARRAAITAALRATLAAPQRSPRVALSLFEQDLGELGAASGIVGLIRVALLLHDKLLPANVGSAASAALVAAAPQLFVPDAAQYWLHDRASGPRRAALVSLSVDGNSHAIVLEETAAAPVPPIAVAPAREALFALYAPNRAELRRCVAQLRERIEIEASNAVGQLAAEWWATSRAERSDDALALAIVARDRAQLIELCARAEVLVGSRADDSVALLDIGAPGLRDRIFFSNTPLTRNGGELAFIYPGSGQHFDGMGRAESARWPHVLERQHLESERLCAQFGGGVAWQDSALQRDDPERAIFAQVTLGAFLTDVLAQFGVLPHAVIGYSLGETTSLFATRTWRDRDGMLARMEASTLFKTELAGECRAARRAFALASTAECDWLTAVIAAPVAAVRACLGAFPRAWVLIVNTHNETVIGGERAQVEALARSLGDAELHRLRAVTTVHCAVVEPVQTEYRALHLFPVTPPAGVRIYSAAAAAAYEVTTASAADSILAQALRGFDTPKLIERAYADGVRFFVEMGPGASCARMVRSILGARPHAARSLCAPGQDDLPALLRLLAHLIAEGVRVDLSPLYAPSAGPTRVGNPERATGGHEISFGRPQVAIALPRPTARSAVPATARVSDELARYALEQVAAATAATARAHAVFLKWSEEQRTALVELQDRHARLAAVEVAPAPIVFDRAACRELAVGRLAAVLGAEFAAVDQFPTRVRLPDEPLLLVDRILAVEAEPRSLSHGRVITEHDVLPGAWYLDAGRIPTCIAVEAGQADLFLSGYLGIDFHTRGLAVYRLLDAEVTFHAPLPRAGATIQYDIRIEEFFYQGATALFRFHFDATVDGERILTMRKGCAGFFTAAELADGRGIVKTQLDLRPQVGRRTGDYQPLVPVERAVYGDAQLAALRRGAIAECFGPSFADLPFTRPATIPGGRMTLVDRVVELDPAGGRFGLGRIRGAADIAPDAWFLMCHFCDDRVMPGTLMYECCLHTLRIFLLRLGWIGEHDEVVCEPIPTRTSRLKCRGQVTADTTSVEYELDVKELGYEADGTPYAIADALIRADGRAIVEMLDMSVRLSGLHKTELEAMWRHVARRAGRRRMAPLFDYERILAFATGKPSVAFGEPYRVFDDQRVIARLPGPPYQFLDRIMTIANAEPFVLAAGAHIETEYDVPADAWYFDANRTSTMPFAVLLEVALQPCGWLAAYLGSALTSDVDLSFRNLGGHGLQTRAVTRASGKLQVAVKLTRSSSSGGMIIQHYDLRVADRAGVLYEGTTYFGFFTRAALRDQVGLRGVERQPPSPALAGAARRSEPYPTSESFPAPQLRMIDQVVEFAPTGGAEGRGFLRGAKRCAPGDWYYQAHFFQDPVMPGSLGLEAFQQLLRYAAAEFWGEEAARRLASPAFGVRHEWEYRGQVIPENDSIEVDVHVTERDDARRLLRADGLLVVEDRVIYRLKNFSVQASP